MAENIESITNVVKMAILAIAFALSLIRLRKRQASDQSLILCLLLACEFVSEIYWQLNHILTDKEYYSFLSAEDMGYLGILLFGAAILDSEGIKKRRKRTWILAILFSALNVGILTYYTGRGFVEGIQGICLCLFMANVFHCIYKCGHISKWIQHVFFALAILLYAGEYALILVEGHIYNLINIFCYIIWFVLFLFVFSEAVRALLSKRDDAPAFVCATFMVSMMAAFLSSGIIFPFFDVMQAVAILLLIPATGMEVAKL